VATAIVGGAAASVVLVVAIVATIIATAFGSGPSALSIAGVWNAGSSTFTFTSSGPDSYTVSEAYQNAPQCNAADDGTVTGSNGHYSGSVNLYQTGSTTTGSCEPKVGVAQITIAIAAGGASANVSTVGNDCPTCGAATWTRKS
jgi:hypothetical protein